MDDDDDDDLYRLKMGRFSDAEERYFRRLFRWRPPNDHGLSSRALSWRVRHVEGGWKFNNGPQVVVKAAGSRKSRSGVRACIRYVARLRANDGEDVPVFDEFGRLLERTQILKAIDGWGLETDVDNLSAKARRQPTVVLPERRRLRNVQAWHFVVSITGDDDDVSDRMIKATAATIDTLFTAKGHRVLWALHRDCPGRPHIHVVVKAQSELGGRIRCDIHGDLFDTMRTEFAINLSRVGLEFRAARREDRHDVRDRIMRGQERLRPNRRRGRGDGDLVRRVPGWVSWFGAEVEQVLKQDESGSDTQSVIGRWWMAIWPKPQPQIRPADEGQGEVVEEFRRMYRDPVRALASWSAMAAEGGGRSATGSAVYPNLRLAEWYLRHQPLTFGELLPGVSGEVARKIKARLPPPNPETHAHSDPVDFQTVQAFSRLRWLRRVKRDRSALIASLVRLAGIARWRLQSESVARRILDRVHMASEVPMGLMPGVKVTARVKFAAEGSRGAESVPNLPSSSSAPILEIQPPNPVPPPSLQMNRRLRRGHGLGGAEL